MIARRRARGLGAALLVLTLITLGLWIALPPVRVTSLVLSSLGNALGLQMSSSGGSRYTLRGSPLLEVHGLIVRQPGAATALLRADRLLVSVPWSTVRSRGATLDITRLELDAPVVDVAALQHWIASRPSTSESSLPTLSDGLRINNGRIDGDGWRIDALALSLPLLAASHPVNARVAGRLRGGAIGMPFDVRMAATRPANDAGVAIVGSVVPQGTDGSWRISARLRAAGRVHADDDGVVIPRLRASLGGRVDARTTRVPFAIAITSPLAWRANILTLQPAGIGLRGHDLAPDIDAHAAFRYGPAVPDHGALAVKLDGTLARWPDTWPTLPAPLGQSTSPLTLSLQYIGDVALSSPVSLALRRDATRFDARLHIDQVLAWTRQPADGTPLPPFTGHLSSPRLQISSATLEGVDIQIDDDAGPSTPAAMRSP